MLFIPAIRGRGRWISELEANLIYRVSSRTARAIQRNPILKKKNEASNFGFEKLIALSGSSVFRDAPATNLRDKELLWLEGRMLLSQIMEV